MDIKKQPALQFLLASARLGVTLLFVSLMFGQGTGGGRPRITGLPTDWTSNHVVFSNEKSPPDFVPRPEGEGSQGEGRVKTVGL